MDTFSSSIQSFIRRGSLWNGDVSNLSWIDNCENLFIGISIKGNNVRSTTGESYGWIMNIFGNGKVNSSNELGSSSSGRIMSMNTTEVEIHKEGFSQILSEYTQYKILIQKQNENDFIAVFSYLDKTPKKYVQYMIQTFVWISFMGENWFSFKI